MRRSRPLLVVAALLFGTACAAVPGRAPLPLHAPRPSATLATTAAILPAELRHRVAILAADSMLGRAVGTVGAERAARYLATEARRLGLVPAGDDGGYLHRVPLHRRRVRAAVGAELDGVRVSLAAAAVVPVSGLGGLPGRPRMAGAGPLVYAGYLFDADPGDEPASDAFDGRVAVVRLGLPPAGAGAPRPALAPLFLPGSRAAAVLLVAEGELTEFLVYAREIAKAGSLLAAADTFAGDNPAYFLVTPAVAERLVGAPLGRVTETGAARGALDYSIAESTVPVEAWNVVASLPGADPVRRGEYVALGAHYDHLGIGASVGGDSILNGADDNASGSAALLELAERYSARAVADRPSRSLLFIWHSAEEGGLHGSDAFTRAPTIPRDSIVAMLNLDMVGRNHPDSLLIIGADRLSSGLGALVAAANARQPRSFVGDPAWDRPGHPERLYCRSDHYNYARFGIPVVHLTTGLHADYHRPSDTADRLDYEKLARVAALAADIVDDVARLPDRPFVDRRVAGPDEPCN